MIFSIVQLDESVLGANKHRFTFVALPFAGKFWMIAPEKPQLLKEQSCLQHCLLQLPVYRSF